MSVGVNKYANLIRMQGRPAMVAQWLRYPTGKLGVSASGTLLVQMPSCGPPNRPTSVKQVPNYQRTKDNAVDNRGRLMFYLLV